MDAHFTVYHSIKLFDNVIQMPFHTRFYIVTYHPRLHQKLSNVHDVVLQFLLILVYVVIAVKMSTNVTSAGQ